MERVIPVVPDAVRIWRGYATPGIVKEKFFEKLGNVFIPITAQNQAPAGLIAYLPTVLPADKPPCLPDEIALVFYNSQTAYSKSFNTCSGRAYGLLHSALFDFPRSKSGFPEYLLGKPKSNTPYYLLNQPADWFTGHSRVLIGTRRDGDSPASFMTGVAETLASVQQRAKGLDGIYFFSTEDYLICWEHQPTCEQLPEPTLIDGLSSQVTVIVDKYATRHSVEYDRDTDHPGLIIKGGEHLNIQFERLPTRNTMRENPLPIYGLHGDCHSAPADTLPSYWASLGGGASGIVAAVQLSADDVLICCPDNQTSDAENRPFLISSHSTKECTRLNAGASFRSVVLDQQNQATGAYGSDTPWKAAAVPYPRLEEVLQTFGRRTKILLLITEGDDLARLDRLIGKSAEMLQSFGLTERVVLIGNKNACRLCREKSPTMPLAYMPSTGETIAGALEIAGQMGVRCLYLSREEVSAADLETVRASGFTFLLTAKDFSLSPADYQEMASQKGLQGLVMKSVDRTVRLVTPPALVMADDFNGTAINRNLWACGYSHCNQDTLLSQNDGLIIAIAEGGDYSGAAAVTRIAVHGDFDVQVDFTVESPQQATTFELAAITIDPGYHHIQNDDLGSKNVNLTFDVHGAPPYASSERDEENGFRIGWNNSHNLTKIGDEYQADSVNMYNKYGPDVGDGLPDNPSGSLRLTRHGSVFNAYYKDKYNTEWVCSGSALVHNMSDEVFLRLAAKHWKKGGSPPANKVTFRRFRLYQP